ncbi:MAG: class I SAM-dependent methyltransferase [Clostridia bacterium]|nr:class I SAM-dependent methyltransferase [Clostridia bacterium]
MYDNFSMVYDTLMYDADYKKRTAYLLKLFKKYGKKPTLLLDVACGTGGFSNEFSKNNIEVIGIDMSQQMLSVACEKSAEQGLDVLYLCQKVEELDLYGTVDGAVCCFDSLNHITDYRNFCKAIDRVSLFLELDSLFIFDLNTKYKHECVLADNVFVIENKDIYCVWANKYKEKNSVVDISLDFFVEQDGLYERFSEQFSERAYSSDEVASALENAGLEIVAIFEDLTEDPLESNSERAVYVTRKVK